MLYGLRISVKSLNRVKTAMNYKQIVDSETGSKLGVIGGYETNNMGIFMGHSTGISDSYCRATENEFLGDYLKAVDS